MAEGEKEVVTQREGQDGNDKASGEEPAKPKGPALEAEKKGFLLMEQADTKVKSASGFFGKLLGYKNNFYK